MSDTTRPSRTALWLALSLVPALLLCALLARYAVDLPAGDAWYTPGNLYMSLASPRGLTFADFIAQHNESRKIFPRLIFLAIARFVGWNTRVELAAIITLVCCIALALFALNRRTVADRTLGGIAFVLTCLLLFSPAQWENWAYTIQLVIFPPFLCVVACLLVSRGSAPFGLKVFASAILSTVATYSSASGMLCWVVAFVALFVKPFVLKATPGIDRPDADRPGPSRVDRNLTYPAPRRRHSIALLAFWLAVWGANLYLYFRDYKVYSSTSRVAKVIVDPIGAIHFWLALAGSIVSAGEPFAGELAGCAVILLFIAVAWVGWRDARLASFEWILLGLHALATDVLIAAARFPYGPPSRYQAFSLFVWVAAFHLAAIVLAKRLRDPVERGRWIPLVACAGALFLLLHVLSFTRGAVRLANLSQERDRGRACLHFVDFNRDRPCFLETLSIGLDDDIFAHIQAANAIGLFDPPLATSGNLQLLSKGQPSVGSLDDIKMQKTGWRWRIDVKGHVRRCAGCGELASVVIAWESPDGASLPFACAKIGENYADLADVARGFVHDDETWSASIDLIDTVPDPERRRQIELSPRISAWGFERHSGTIFPMEGSFRGTALRPASIRSN